VQQFGSTPSVQEEILVPVVVVVAPDGPHRRSVGLPVQVRDSQRRCNVLEGAVPDVPVEGILRTGRAGRDIQVVPAVAIDVNDGNGGAIRGDHGHDRLEFGIEYRCFVHEVDTGCLGNVLQNETVAHERVGCHAADVRISCRVFGVPHGHRCGEQRDEHDGREDAQDALPVHRSRNTTEGARTSAARVTSEPRLPDEGEEASVR
jgi:hypothetical protein